MKEVIEEVLHLIDKNEPFVMATVVRTRGSTPQKAGAKLLIRQDGSSVGTLGGGCIEGEIWYLATQVLRERGGPLFCKYDLNEEFAARDGLVCGGTMYFFVDPILKPNYFKPFAQEIMRAYQRGQPVAIATVVNVPEGKSNLGAKLLVREDGSAHGSLGDEEKELEAVRIGKIIAAYGCNKSIEATDGMEIFVEGYTASPTMILLGGGHVNKAVSRLASTLGFRIYIVDDRPEFANKERFSEAEGVIVDDYSRALEKIPVNSNTYIVVATRGHRYDDMALAAAIRTPARFVGLLGSKRKTLEIYKNLLRENVPPERIQEVHAPIGLNIGALTPEELAVSIMAEIIMIRNGGNGASMKMNAKYLNKIIAK